MTIVATTNIHGVESVTMQTMIYENFSTMRITLTTDDGAVVTLDAFSKEPLQCVQLPLRDCRPQEVAV